MIQLKRVYEPASPADGERILVDRIWPRGIRKAETRIDRWAKDLAPSTELRKWFSHDVGKWVEFRRRYRIELEPHSNLLAELAAISHRGTLTLVYSAKDEDHNQAVVLKQVIEDLAQRKA